MTDWERQFVYAIAFCLASDQDRPELVRGLRAWFDRGDGSAANEAVGALLDAARWALKSGDAPAELSDERKRQRVALVSGGATRIKGYVFESARLPEIRGASGLLDRINLSDLPTLWKRIGCGECVIYANGGEILAFAPVGAAAALADAIESAYAHRTLTAQSVAVTQTFTLEQVRDGLAAGQPAVDADAAVALLGHNPAENRTFGSLVAPLALAKYRRREGNEDAERQKRPQPHFETVPFARRCESCDRRAAVVVRPVAAQEDRFQSLCESCARKRGVGQRSKRGFWIAEFEKWLHKQGRPAAVTAPKDLNAIAEASKQEGFVGVVYADGNNMGALLERLQTPVEYATFAKAVFDATKNAVFGALEANLRTNGGAAFRPFEILSIGGDDLFLIVPADAALPVACDIAERVETDLLAEHTDMFAHPESYPWEAAQRCAGAPAPQCRVGLSVGVVLAPEHTPVYHLQNFAEVLLKSAKKRAKWLKRECGCYGGTIDFLSLKSVGMIGDTVEDFRRAALLVDHGRLTARPYTIAETRALIEGVRLLKASGFPKGQLHRLRASLRDGLYRSTVDYLYFLSRSGDLRRAREEIERLWTPEGVSPPHPWRVPLERAKGGDAPERETIWHDLVELYDFVPGEAADAASDD